jgi:hypothetical protein
MDSSQFEAALVADPSEKSIAFIRGSTSIFAITKALGSG